MLSLSQLVREIHTYSPDADTQIVERAYRYAQQAHQGQRRHSGEEYFAHPVAVARHLARIQLDPVTIAAGLLHDVPEDTNTPMSEIEQVFGKEVAFLVDGVTKLGKVRMSQQRIDQADQVDKTDKAAVSREKAASENLRKMFLAMAEDIRVVVIKLADRHHNMQTLSAVPVNKQFRIARETLDIYAPLAERLGMGEMKGVLQDLAFPYVDPEGHQWISQASAPLYRDTEKYLTKVIKFVSRELCKGQIESSIHGRNKHLYSLYQKIQSKDRDFTEVYDLVAVRILVNDIAECYEVLGLLHQNWKPLLGRIKDYIALPKPNGYQSLHTTVFCLDGRVVEFQIRTHQMHREAEYGIAAHWGYSSYKSGSVTGKASRLAWVQQLANWQSEIASSDEFMEGLKIDTFRNRIFVFTPNGEVKDLPVGAKPLDFAYSVHSKIGQKCVGAKVNGKLVTLNTSLENGDMVEILTSPKANPNPDWLDMVITSSARAHVRRYLRENQPLDLEAKEEAKPVRPLNAQPAPLKIRPVADQNQEVIVDGTKGYLVRLAKCCKPAVGDSIMGIVTIGQGISVHKRWCSNIQNVSDRGRLISVAWTDDSKHRTNLILQAYDKPGLTREVANILARRRANIIGISGSANEDGIGTINLTIDLPTNIQATDLISDLLTHKSIFNVSQS